MLPVIGMAHFHASNFGHCIGGVGLLQRAGHKIFFANRLSAIARVNAGGAQKQQLLDSVKVSLVDHVRLDENIFPDKLRGAGGIGQNSAYAGRGKHHVDECANASYYQHRAWLFVRNHPGGKAKLAGLAVRMEWDPRTTASATDSGHGAIRTWAQPVYTSLLYALGLLGLLFAPRRLSVLALALLAYQTLAAVIFVGATRYRIPTDFLIALLAAAVFERVLGRRLRVP